MTTLTSPLLLLGDCLERLKELPDGSVDMVVTSPPYDNLRTYNNTLNDWNEDKWKAIQIELTRVLKVGGVIVWVVGDATIDGSETLTSMRQAIHFKDVCGLNVHDTMIWNKNSFANPSSNRCHQVFEYMFVLSKGKPRVFNEILDRKNKYLGIRGASGRDKDGNRKQGTSEVKREYGQRFNIWDISVGGGMSYKGPCNHPAVFPESLASDHVLSWSNEGDMVLDPFLGSGTTGVACVNTGRKFIGIERDEEYMKIAEARIAAAIESRKELLV